LDPALSHTYPIHTLPPYLNPLRPSGNYMNHLLWQSVMLNVLFIGFAWFSL
jgi:hypothetical protein